MPGGAIFLKHQETTMTLEHHIEELRAEIRGCIDLNERRQIELELAAALEELAHLGEKASPS
jgi:hypothetical protein